MPNPKDVNITPQTDLNPSLSRLQLGQQSLPSLSTMMGRILEEGREELKFPASLITFKRMMLDLNLSTAVSLIETMISRVGWAIHTPPQASEKELNRAEMLNYNIQTMERPWEEYINEALSYLVFGFIPIEKIYANIKTPYGDFNGLSNLKPISQSSVSRWFFNERTGGLLGLEQDISGLRSRSTRLSSTKAEIPRKKFLLFRHNPKLDNPEGVSPLKACYVTWKYLAVVEEYETIGISKDLGGLPTFYVPYETLAKAESDPTSWEAILLSNLKTMGANIHAGSQSCAIIPTAYDDSGKSLFDFKLLGIDGGGKQYNTQEIAQRHSSKMLMAFFADVLKLGTDQHGSFSLADTKTSILAMSIEAHLKNIQRTLNHDLMRQIYQLNSWEYNPTDSCYFAYGDLEKEDLDTLSSAIQRVAATGMIRPTNVIETHLLDKFMGLPSVEESEAELLETKNTSGSSKGMTKGLNDGVGDSTSSGADRSINNKEN